jgi:drug/metabolite transporter (DMT)-like permease
MGGNRLQGRVSRLSSTTRVWIALGIVYVVWGSTYLGIREAIQTIPPFLMAATRFLVAGALLYAWGVRGRRPEDDPIGPRQWLASAVVGGLLLVTGNGGLVWAEQHVASGVAALIISGVPIWMAVIAALLGEERLRLRTLGALVVGLGGTALLVRSVESGGGTVSIAGVVVLVFASISWASGSVLSRRLPVPRRPLMATAMEMLCGGAMLAVLGVSAGEIGRVHLLSISAASWAGLVYLILFGSLVAFSAYVWVLANATPSLVSTYAYVNPVIAVFLGWAVLSERVTALTLLAAAVIVGAVAVIVLGQAREKRARVAAGQPVSGL